jgi:diadenylate cyclase
MKTIFDTIQSRAGIALDRTVLDDVVSLAVELAREGREGRKVGTIFIVGDHESVLSQSRPLILDPLYGHPPEAKRVEDPNVRETLKELAQLDGGFVISDDGVAISGARYLYSNARDVELPLGLGGRHMAAAAASKATKALAVVVSESSVIRLFARGELIAEIVPELWMLSRRALRLSGLSEKNIVEDMAVFTRAKI